MSLITELWMFMRVRKKFWLLPILVMMVVFGGLVILASVSFITWRESVLKRKNRTPPAVATKV